MKKRSIPLLFVLPAIFFYTLIVVYPMLQSFYMSFTDWNGLSPKYHWVGLDNFVEMTKDERLINAIGVTLKYAVTVVLLMNAAALLFALLLNKAGNLIGFARSIFFTPVVLSSVAVAFIWNAVYAYNGALNYVLDGLHLSALKLPWLSNGHVSIFSVAAVDIWKGVGFHMVIYLAALQTIPKDIYEAAEIDGAGVLHTFSRITLPLLVPGLMINVLLSTVNALKQFDFIKIMTNGGPGFDTETITYNIVERAFESSMQGYASAIALVLFVAIAIVSLVQLKFFAKREVEY